MTRIRVVVIMIATGALFVPQVIAPPAANAQSPPGCPGSDFSTGLFIADQCLQPGTTGHTTGEFEGIDVTVHNVYLQGGDVMADATVANSGYIGTCAPGTPTCGGLNGTGTLPCPAPPFQQGYTCIPSPITEGQWVLGIYDKAWQGAPLNPATTSGNLRASSKDQLAATCADVTTCNPVEDVAAHLCLGTTTEQLKETATQTIETIRDAVIHHHPAEVEKILKQDPLLKGVTEVPAAKGTRPVKIPSTVVAASPKGGTGGDSSALNMGDLLNLIDNCAANILIKPGEERSGLLGFDASNIGPGQNVAVIWNYGGAGFAWTCKLDKAQSPCKPVHLTSPRPPSSTTMPTAPTVTSDCSAGSITSAVLNDPNFNAYPGEVDQVVTVDKADPSWVLFQDVPPPGNAAGFAPDRGVAQCLNGNWQIANDPAAPGLTCTVVPSDVAVQLGVNTDTHCTPR